MANPLAPNVTFDLYHVPNYPPNPPDSAAVRGYLRPAFASGQESGEGANTAAWTHILFLEPGLDIRDGYVGAGQANTNTGDHVFLSDQTGTEFRVQFVERRNRGAASEHLVAYLDRQIPPWPTQEL